MRPRSPPRTAVEQPHPTDRVGDLGTVCADVLNRRGTGGTGDTGQAFQPAQPVCKRRHDDVVPRRSGLCAHDVALDGDLGVGEQDDGEVGEVVGQHDVGSAREHEGIAVGAERARHVDDLLGGVAGDQPLRNGSHAQGGQRRQRHRLGDGRAADERGDHGR